MTSIPISVFSQNAAQYVAHAVNSQDVISVTTEKGSAVLLSEEEFRGMMETIYLLNSEGMAERVEEARRTPIGESDDSVW